MGDARAGKKSMEHSASSNLKNDFLSLGKFSALYLDISTPRSSIAYKNR